jgi:O-antigen/teichoic acid export membrane protein
MIRNVASILTSDVLNRATTFVIYLLVGRYLGPYEFGQLALGLTLFYTFQVVAVGGIKTLITREIARDKTKTEKYFFNGSMLVSVFFILSITSLLLFIWVMKYATETAVIIFVLSLGLLPYALSAVCEAVFQAWEQMHYIAYANVPTNIAKVCFACLIVVQGYGLFYLIILMLAVHIGRLGIEWWLVRRFVSRSLMRIDFRFSLGITKRTITFLGIDSIIAIWSGINVLLLSKLATETEVGFYSAAAQLMVPVKLIYLSIVLSIFPIMCRKFDSSIQSLKNITEYLIEFLFAVAMPAAVLILTALTSALGQLLLASQREKVTLRIVAFSALVNLLLGLALISRYGVIGAATATLLTGVFNFFQHYLSVSKLLSTIPLARLAWKPCFAVTIMAIYLKLLGKQSIFLIMLSAGVIYGTALLVLTVWSVGGLYQFKAKCRSLWSQEFKDVEGRSVVNTTSPHSLN